MPGRIKTEMTTLEKNVTEGRILNPSSKKMARPAERPLTTAVYSTGAQLRSVATGTNSYRQSQPL